MCHSDIPAPESIYLTPGGVHCRPSAYQAGIDPVILIEITKSICGLLARWPKCSYVDHGTGPVLQPKVGGKLTSPVLIAVSSTITKSADDGDLLVG